MEFLQGRSRCRNLANFDIKRKSDIYVSFTEVLTLGKGGADRIAINNGGK